MNADYTLVQLSRCAQCASVRGHMRRCGYSGWLISENFYDRGPIGKLSEDPVELMQKDYQALKGIAW